MSAWPPSTYSTKKVEQPQWYSLSAMAAAVAVTVVGDATRAVAVEVATTDAAAMAAELATTVAVASAWGLAAVAAEAAVATMEEAIGVGLTACRRGVLIRMAISLLHLQYFRQN